MSVLISEWRTNDGQLPQRLKPSSLGSLYATAEAVALTKDKTNKGKNKQKEQSTTKAVLRFALMTV
jgi:hypothetical protein